jgi:hypothetical protein
MQRLPQVLVENVQLTTSYAVYYTAPANTYATISAATFNNTSGGAVTVSVSIVPASGAQANANELATNLSIPAAGAAPTVASSLIGQTLKPGETLQIKGGSATSITPRISGYETTL